MKIKQEQLIEKLRKSLLVIDNLVGLIESNDLVRNTDNDNNFSKFTNQSLKISKALSDAISYTKDTKELLKP